ncbi:MAG: calcium-binding protein [Rhodospirillales bacterium]|nr:calcium-binding protein [Rhodospirillales bacterium]
MGTYKGTSAADTITPGEISGGVGRVPAGSFPSTDADALDGRRGNDILDGGGGADAIRGGGGDDEIGDNVGRGQAGVDLDTPNAGNVIHGDAGNDEIRIEGRDAGGENPFGNTAYGEGGRDLIEFIFYGDLDQGVNSGRSPTGAIVGSGGAGADTLRVDSVAIQPTDLTVTLKGGAGADKLSATAWIVEYDGSAMGGGNPDRLVGGAGDDVYEVYEQKDLVVERPNEGYDTVVARDTDYTLPSDVEKLEMNPAIYGTDPKDRHGVGNDLDNLILGWAVTDGVQRLDGAGGDDVIYGGTFADAIDGGDGNDTLYGRRDGLGDTDTDTLRGGPGNDKIHGGLGIDDRADTADEVYGDAGNDDIWAGGGDDMVYGGDGNDNLYGQSDNDTLRGGAGNERVYGGTGNDTLYGDLGADTVRGGAGLDLCDGGAGNDRYDYKDVTDSSPGEANRDVILAFDGVGKAAGDRIDLATIDAKPGISGNQAFTFKGAGAITGPGQVHVVASGDDTLVRANTGGSLDPELEILVKDGAAGPSQWVAGDFIL